MYESTARKGFVLVTYTEAFLWWGHAFELDNSKPEFAGTFTITYMHDVNFY